MSALAAVHLAANHALGIRHGNAAFAHAHEGDGGNHDQHAEDQDDGDKQRLDAEIGDQRGNAGNSPGEQRSDDASEDQQRDAVANAVLRDALADPHRKRGAGRHRDTDDAGGDEGRTKGIGLHRAHADDQADGLDEAKDDGGITGVLRNFLAAFLAFLLEILQIRNGNGEQLHDNGRVDVRRDAHRHDGHLAELVTSHGSHEVQQREVLHCRGDLGGINTSNRDDAGKAVHEQHDERIQDLLAKVLYLPCVAYRLKHVRSPRLSRPQPRSFLWQNW